MNKKQKRTLLSRFLFTAIVDNLFDWLWITCYHVNCYTKHRKVLQRLKDSPILEDWTTQSRSTQFSQSKECVRFNRFLNRETYFLSFTFARSYVLSSLAHSSKIINNAFEMPFRQSQNLQPADYKSENNYCSLALW